MFAQKDRKMRLTVAVLFGALCALFLRKTHRILGVLAGMEICNVQGYLSLKATSALKLILYCQIPYY